LATDGELKMHTLLNLRDYSQKNPDLTFAGAYFLKLPQSPPLDNPVGRGFLSEIFLFGAASGLNLSFWKIQLKIEFPRNS
jgi:hypothetical protein